MHNRKKKIILFASCLMLIVLVIVVIGITVNRTVAVIYIDVNPSIEIEVDSSNKVVNVDANNEDAKLVINNMNLKGVNIDVALNAIIGSMLKNGFLDNLDCSILLSIDGENEELNKALNDLLISTIGNIYEESQLEGSIISQSVWSNEEITKLANEFGISVAKASLIKEICNMDQSACFEDLAKLSISDINILLEAKSINLSNISIIDIENIDIYIGEEQALSIALTHAKIESGYSLKSISFNQNDDAKYIIEFSAGEANYIYQIDALEGKIIGYDKKITLENTATQPSMSPHIEEPAPTQTPKPSWSDWSEWMSRKEMDNLIETEYADKEIDTDQKAQYRHSVYKSRYRLYQYQRDIIEVFPEGVTDSNYYEYYSHFYDEKGCQLTSGSVSEGKLYLNYIQPLGDWSEWLDGYRWTHGYPSSRDPETNQQYIVDEKETWSNWSDEQVIVELTPTGLELPEPKYESRQVYRFRYKD